MELTVQNVYGLLLRSKLLSVEVTIVPGSKNSYIEESTGDKYIVMPDGSVTRIAHTKKVASTK